MAIKKTVLKQFEKSTGHRLVPKGDYYQIYKKPGPESKTFRNGHTFEKVRKQNTKFADLNRIAKDLRVALRDFLADLRDGRLVNTSLSFVYKLCADIDFVNRQIELGAKQEEIQFPREGTFENFNFLSGQLLGNLLKMKPRLTGSSVVFDDFIASRTLKYPNNATHCEMSVAKFDIQLSEAVGFSVTSKSKIISINDRRRSLKYKFDGDETLRVGSLFLVKITFLNKKIRLAVPAWRAMGVVGC